MTGTTAKLVAIMLVLTAGTLCTPVLAAEQSVLAAEQQRIDVMQRVAKTVVAVFGAGGAGGGSGVLISNDGYALTNFHVVQGSGAFMKCGLNDGVLYDSVIVGIDPTGDVALIKLLGRDDFPTATLGDSDKLRLGDPVFAMGNPFLLATDFHPTVTAGIVSGVHRYQYPAGTLLEYTDCIQTDASINPGNSGGPLVNSAGQLVGINGRISVDKRGRVNVGAGYAISINQIKHFMDHLRSGRVVDHATLGATVSTSADGGVLVSHISEDSPAYRRGLRLDDEIVTFAGRSIRSVNQFKNILGIYPKNWQLPLTFRRTTDEVIETHEITVRLQPLHHASELTLQKKPRPGPKRKPTPPQQTPQDPSTDSPAVELTKYFEKRAGFVNYYFNKLERDRTLREMPALGDFSAVHGKWVFTGRTDNGQDFRIVFGETGIGMLIGETAFLQPLGEDRAAIDEPVGTGGFLAALNHFRRLLTQGSVGFSEFYYLGSMPLDGRGERADMIVAERLAAQSQWYFDQVTGALVGFDFWISDDVDPCEVRFESPRQFEKWTLPATWIVRHAGKTFVTLHLQSCEFSNSAKPTGEEG